MVLLFGYFVVCKSLLQLSLSSFQQEIIRDNHCAQQAPTNPTTRNKNPWKNRSVASVIRDRFWTWRARQRRVSISCGTVFQTALHELLVIPRLRPGLLSLRSVLAYSQILVLSIINHAFMNYQLWIVNYELWIVNCQLWIILLLRLTAQCARAQNSSRIAPMRRILSFSRIFFLRFTWSWIFLRIVFAPIGAG